MTETHIPPRYYGYRGGFDKVGKCKCGIVSLYEDYHPVHPCWNCGAGDRDREWFAAKWIETSKWWQIKSRGYWQRSKA